MTSQDTAMEAAIEMASRCSCGHEMPLTDNDRMLIEHGFIAGQKAERERILSGMPPLMLNAVLPTDVREAMTDWMFKLTQHVTESLRETEITED